MTRESMFAEAAYEHAPARVIAMAKLWNEVFIAVLTSGERHVGVAARTADEAVALRFGETLK